MSIEPRSYHGFLSTIEGAMAASFIILVLSDKFFSISEPLSPKSMPNQVSLGLPLIAKQVRQINIAQIFIMKGKVYRSSGLVFYFAKSKPFLRSYLSLFALLSSTI